MGICTLRTIKAWTVKIYKNRTWFGTKLADSSINGALFAV